MSKAKYSQMDKTSGQMAAFLDKKREQNKKRAHAKARYERSSLSRGGFR